MQLELSKIKIAVLGLGYVGLPLAVEFSKKYDVIGFDLSKKRIAELRNGIDKTKEIEKNLLERNNKKLFFSSDENDIKPANVYIITVPTPINERNEPDLIPLKLATRIVGLCIKKDDLIIYESTVFPNCTEQICVPILEKHSDLMYNEDFFCGYSPERINPGDKHHTLTKVKKITSGSNSKVAEFVDNLYKSIITAGTFKASSIAVAEAAKVIENTQRDVNIALINELAFILKKMNIDTKEVIDAASTKWNFSTFYPGLVGGHCIGVDPYYLTHAALKLGYEPEMILAGRRINESVGDFIAKNTLNELATQKIKPHNAKITILGLTFKENCPDIRNSKVISIINVLRSFNCKISISDYWVDPNEAKKKIKLDLTNLDQIEGQDAIIIAVSHDDYKKFILEDWRKMLNSNGVVIDVKSIYDRNTFAETSIRYWRL